MLYAQVRQGRVIFSAYDWFRELARRRSGRLPLFANMLSAAKAQ